MCCYKQCAKLILIGVNVVFLLAGVVMFGFGIVAKSKPDLIVIMLGKIPGISKIPAAFDLGGIFTASAIFMMVLGIAVAGVGFFGFCGACCESKDLLKAYIIILVVVFVAEVALIGVAAVAPFALKGTIQHAMNKSMDEFRQDITVKKGGDLTLPTKPISLGWTFLQFGASCCGTYNYSDYSNWNHSVAIEGENISAEVPISCCRKTKDLNLELLNHLDISVFNDLDGCLAGNKTFINPKNCYDSIFEIILRSRSIAIGIAAAIIVVELVLIFLAAVLRSSE